ncbi:MAG: hypothetical protein ACI8QS_001617 [Planctomycetota bacterium]|jgi:hypothetical protein
MKSLWTPTIASLIQKPDSGMIPELAMVNSDRYQHWHVKAQIQ